MVEALRDGRDPGLLLHVVLDFLNSPQFIEFTHELTSDRRIRMVSAMAARYRQGHFLNAHNDSAKDEDRAFAYVINLGRGWQPDWGGQLHLLDGGDDIETSDPYRLDVRRGGTECVSTSSCRWSVAHSKK